MVSRVGSKIKRIFLDYWPLLLIISSFMAIVLPRLQSYGFWDWDECVYTQYPITMRQTGNFLTHYWNGLPVFDKPPLTAWLIQLFSINSITETSARFTIIVLTIALFLSVYLFAKKYFSDKVAILSLLALLTGELLVIYAIRVNTDIAVTLFTFLGFYFWVESYSKSRFSYLSGIAFGLAVLSKGLSVGPYFVAIFISLLLLPRKKYFLNYGKMLGVFLAVIIPWHLYQYLVYGNSFINFYFIENIIKRAQNPLEFHFEGRLFYFKLIYKNFFPWIFFFAILPLSYIFTFKKFLDFKQIKKEFEKKRIIFSILIIIAVTVVMITTIKTRIAWYALPLYPFIALFIGYNINFLLAKLPFKKIFFTLIVLFLLIDSYKLISHETLVKNQPSINNRNLIFVKSKAYPVSSIEYLVQFSERRGRETLAPNLQTSITFIYGGNPCAVFYSGKRVDYYYSPDKFVERIKQAKGLFVVENGDLHFIKDLPITIVYKNTDFTLFTN